MGILRTHRIPTTAKCLSGINIISKTETLSFCFSEQLAAGGLRKAVVEGDTRTGSLMAGQSAGLVKEECTCKEFIERITAEAIALMGKKVE